jgi:hypothetical protein
MNYIGHVTCTTVHKLFLNVLIRVFECTQNSQQQQQQQRQPTYSPLL